MYNNIFKLKNIDFKKTFLFRLIFLKNQKHLKYRKEKITIFHMKKKFFNKLKKNVRKRKIFFYHIKKSSTNFFLFNKPKSTLVKKKRK